MDIITPATKTINNCVQQLQKEGKIVQSMTSAPGPQMGAWTMRGYGMPQEKSITEIMLPRIKEFGKPLNSINFLV